MANKFKQLLEQHKNATVPVTLAAAMAAGGLVASMAIGHWTARHPKKNNDPHAFARVDRVETVIMQLAPNISADEAHRLAAYFQQELAQALNAPGTASLRSPSLN